MTIETGISCYQELTNYFTSEHIIKVLGILEYNKFINRNDAVSLVTWGSEGNNSKPTTTLIPNLKETIDDETLWMMGMWYTDGTHSYKGRMGVYNTNDDVIDRCCDIFSTKKSKGRTNSISTKPCYYVAKPVYSNYKLLISKLFIYENINVKSIKSVDLGLLSTLSKKQFYNFFAGLMDGDGSVGGSFCNFNSDIPNISQLLRWNGSFVNERKTSLLPYLNSVDKAQVLSSCSIKKRVQDINDLSMFEDKAPQRSHRAFKKDNKMFIRVNSVEKSDEILKMMDIETKTHYFKYNGITTHNSMTFDIPYITNRIARVMDGYVGTKENLNKKSSYVDMPNVNRLSPIGEVRGRPRVETKDGMTGVTHKWQGIYLIDYKELAIKYGFLGLASYSLKNIAKHFDLSQKIDHSTYANFDDFYTGDGYIFPLEAPENDEIYDIQLSYKEGRVTKKEMQQVVYNRFTEYSLRDVEILVELDRLKKYLAAHRGIAYLCGVTMDDNWNTLSHWSSLVYKEAFKQRIVLPLVQQNAKFDTVFLAGWVRTIPGKYQYITSFDFTSLYPSLIRTYNIGADTYISDDKLPKELLELRKKYFWYYSKENLNRIPYEVNDYNKTVYRNIKGEVCTQDEGGIETPAPLGKITIKHSDEINDIQEETNYFLSIVSNKDKIVPVLKKYNVGVTPNGYFYNNSKQATLSKQMENIFEDRVRHKREAQRLYELIQQGDKSKETAAAQEYHDNMSMVLKIVLNSVYGSTALKYNTFSNGQVTASSITTAGRFSNKMVALACSQKVQKILKEKVTNELIYIPQSDTDSLYLNIDNILDMSKFKNLSNDKKIKIAMKLSQINFQDVINKTISTLNESMNVKDTEPLKMENEVITDGFVSVALKRYYTRVVVNDGAVLSKPKMKIVGLNLISKTTPDYLKEKLKPVLNIILDGSIGDLRTYIKEAMNGFKTVSALDIVRISAVNNLSYTKKGHKYKRQKTDGKWLTAPLASHASLEHNRYIKEHNLEGQYPPIERGESVSYCYVTTPNEQHISSSIAFKDPRFSLEVDLNNIIDRTTHFEKDFMAKIEIITDKLNWNIRKTTQVIDIW